MAEGRVEIHLNGEWWNVCGYTWDPLDAAVVCRQLGFTTALNTYCRSSQNDFGRSSLKYWQYGMKCTGHESKLVDCQQDVDPEIEYLCANYAQYQDADGGVVCTNDSRQAQPGGTVILTPLL